MYELRAAERARSFRMISAAARARELQKTWMVNFFHVGPHYARFQFFCCPLLLYYARVYVYGLFFFFLRIGGRCLLVDVNGVIYGMFSMRVARRAKYETAAGLINLNAFYAMAPTYRDDGL